MFEISEERGPAFASSRGHRGDSLPPDPSQVAESKALDPRTTLAGEGKAPDLRTTLVGEGEALYQRTTLAGEGKALDLRTTLVGESNALGPRTTQVSEGKALDPRATLLCEGEARDLRTTLLCEGEARDLRTTLVGRGEALDQRTTQVGEGKALDPHPAEGNALGNWFCLFKRPEGAVPRSAPIDRFQRPQAGRIFGMSSAFWIAPSGLDASRPIESRGRGPRLGLVPGRRPGTAGAVITEQTPGSGLGRTSVRRHAGWGPDLGPCAESQDRSAL